MSRRRRSPDEVPALVGITVLCGTACISSFVPAVAETLNTAAWWLLAPVGGAVLWLVGRDIRQSVAVNREVARSWRDNGASVHARKPLAEPVDEPVEVES